MAFTDLSDVFGSVHEDGVNLVALHVMRQRPSLLNYATPTFHARPDLFCRPIEASKSVLQAQNPLFTEVEPLPVFGAPFPLGIDFCLQLTEARVDLAPQDMDLPRELGELPPQGFALKASACAGIACPPKDVIDELLPRVESELVAQQKRPSKDRPPRDTVVLPTRRLECFCLELFVVGRLEWGPVAGSDQSWLKARLGGVEIVDLGPQPLEESIECYAATVLRLGVLPQLMVPLEKLVLDITKVMREQGLLLGKQVTLGPSAVPGDVPNNPAVEDDMVKVFAKLTVTDGGA